jgi:ATP-dependent Clp protease ATP-binding subunit ClpA
VIQRAVIHVRASGRPAVTGAEVFIALFSEQESRAALFLAERGVTRLDAVNFLARGITKGGGTAAA